ncbi:transmembrane protein 134 isoform X6 [Neophocaena asiaeorientalis asiaeorientalis]|uniref:Transmembrane protein 134 isoform X6 n=1 Tax=Neophocaena asiaeorientalis asiaeorientalis TaxID=1706337 RepID=A0A341BTY0_NEOAA|nr:transmembrane protein 134 isoform X6 [Neophocaena asiaeorientalis asiaeorientalis]
MTPSSCPWRTRALGLSPAGSPASGRCTSSAGPGSRWPTRTSSPGCATRTWRTMRMEPRPLRSRMGEPAPGQGQEHLVPVSAPSPRTPSRLLSQRVPLLTSPCPLAGPIRPAGILAEHLSAAPSGPLAPSAVALSAPTMPAAVLILTGVGLEVAPSPGVSSAIFFVPGFLLLVPGVYHVTFIYCAVKGHRGFQFFYLPYFEK